MASHELPVSGWKVAVREPTGAEDLLLQEAGELNTGLAFQLFDRLVEVSRDRGSNWSGLSITDLETLLLLVRCETLGDVIRAETECTSPGCRARVDVWFRVTEYLASQKPRIPRGVEGVDQDQTYRLTDTCVRFRLPNGEDLLAIDGEKLSKRSLMKRCVPEQDIPNRLSQRIERAMEAMAPSLSRTMSGECPECHTTMNFYFDVRQFVMLELRDHAASVFEDVHLLAVYYKWAEEAILALPRSRRLRYSAALRRQGDAA